MQSSYSPSSSLETTACPREVRVEAASAVAAARLGEASWFGQWEGEGRGGGEAESPLGSTLFSPEPEGHLRGVAVLCCSSPPPLHRPSSWHCLWSVDMAPCSQGLPGPSWVGFLLLGKDYSPALLSLCLSIPALGSALRGKSSKASWQAGRQAGRQASHFLGCVDSGELTGTLGQTGLRCLPGTEKDSPPLSFPWPPMGMTM